MTAVTLEMIVFDRSDLDENTGIALLALIYEQVVALYCDKLGIIYYLLGLCLGSLRGEWIIEFSGNSVSEGKSHGMRNLPGSPSFSGNFLRRTAEQCSFNGVLANSNNFSLLLIKLLSVEANLGMRIKASAKLMSKCKS
ncbi:hypothetical protein Tco_0237010 [Tanacetum coccineum]